MTKFYVKAETARGKVIGYSVLDCVGGLESEHACYRVTAHQPAEAALILANAERDRLNAAARLREPSSQPSAV